MLLGEDYEQNLQAHGELQIQEEPIRVLPHRRSKPYKRTTGVLLVVDPETPISINSLN